jgi:SAM-dependent methyltransferase
VGQANSGLYSLLKHPALFNAVQRVVRSDARKILVDEYIKPRPGDRLLDIGCGPGGMVPYLEDVEFTGVDPEPAYVDLARATYGARGTFMCAGVNDMTDEYEQRFDRVIAVGVLHHIEDGPARTLFDVARRALKPGGRLVTSDPVWREGQNPLARLAIAMDRGKSVRSPEGYCALAGRSFARVEVFLRSDFMRIPYDHCILVCENEST